MNLYKKLDKVLKIYMKFEEYFLVACLTTMGLVLTTQIVLRYVFNSPISWAEELARYLQIWITFFGMGFAFRKKGHIALDLIVERLNPKIARLINIFNDFVMIVCSSFVICYAPTFLKQQHKLSSTLHVPLYLVYGMIPVGFGIMILYLIADIIMKIGKQEETEGGN